MKFLHSVRDCLVYLAARLMLALIGAMSRQILQKFANGCGRLLYHFPGFGSLCVKNIRAAFPDMPAKQVRNTARKSLQNLVFTIMESFWIRKHPGEFERLLDLSEADEVGKKGLEKIRTGGGAVMITSHLGNWEFAGRVLAALYHYPMTTVVRSSRNPFLDRLINGNRCANGMKIIFAKGAARTMKQVLDNGRSVGILIDQNTRVRDGGVFVRFFGLLIPVSRAPAVLVRGKNRFIAVGAVIHTGDTCKGILRELPKPVDEYRSDEELIQAITDITEQFIRLAPDQYLWLYKRFQYIPPHTPDEIKKRYPDYAVEPGPTFYSRKVRSQKKKNPHSLPVRPG